MYGSDLGFTSYIYTNFGRRLVGNLMNISLFIICCVQINSSIYCLLLDKSTMVNDIPENDDDGFVCMNPVSTVSGSLLASSRPCGLWSPQIVLRMYYKTLNKVIILLPCVDYEDAFTFLFLLQE
jgi:hypothetical protein